MHSITQTKVALILTFFGFIALCFEPYTIGTFPKWSVIFFTSFAFYIVMVYNTIIKTIEQEK